jgi:hypothetical protein
MPVIDTGGLVRPPFTAEQFTTTKWDTAADKAAFANTLCHFMAADFRENLFTKKLYRRLSLSFGMIAHYNEFEFYDHFFRDLQGKVAFLEETLSWRPCGQPEFTFCDVEHAVQVRLSLCDLPGAYRALRAAEVEGAERALLVLLRQKYEGPDTPAPASVPIPHAGSVPKAARKQAPHDQASLF